MMTWLFLALACLLAVPAAADDPAQANRLLVEAAQLVKAAESPAAASEKLALLEVAIAKLNEIIEHHPSSGLAVKLATNQPIGSLSLAELTGAVEALRSEVARQRPTGEESAAGPHLAAVGEETSFVMQIDVAGLAATSFGREFHAIFRRALESSGERERRVIDALLRHLRDTVWIVVAADLSRAGKRGDLDEVTDEVVVQFTSGAGFDIAAMMEELTALRAGNWFLWSAHTAEGDPAYKVVSPYDSFYVLPGADASVFFAGPRLEPLAAARRRHASGNGADAETLMELGLPEAHVSLGGLLPRSVRERLRQMPLLEPHPVLRELPLREIMGHAFEVGRVRVAAGVDRHATVNLALNMDTAFSANLIYVLGSTVVQPVLLLMDEGLFVSEPVLELDGLTVTWRFEFNGDVLLERFEASLQHEEPASEPGALPDVPEEGAPDGQR